MPWDNAHTKAVSEEMEVLFWEGWEEGYDDIGPLPAFYFDKPVVRLRPKELGYVVGRTTRMKEAKE